MSVLPPDVHSALGSLLQRLQSPDNNTRAHAEEQLNNKWVVSRADVLLMGLVEQVQGASEAGVPIQFLVLSGSLTGAMLATFFRSRAVSAHRNKNTEGAWHCGVERPLHHPTTTTQGSDKAKATRVFAK